ncbi:hypothetical protein BOQ62_02605 [Chryseobacterium sp. CH21]|nr:hypothetical protein BOQ62_02605 [Chryseobacterium sp. CH21]
MEGKGIGVLCLRVEGFEVLGNQEEEQPAIHTSLQNKTYNKQLITHNPKQNKPVTRTLFMN